VKHHVSSLHTQKLPRMSQETQDVGALLVRYRVTEEQSHRFVRVDLPALSEVMLAMHDANQLEARSLWRFRRQTSCWQVSRRRTKGSGPSAPGLTSIQGKSSG
jgi:glycyl-tRNA synthetase alpha subunit